MKTALIHEWFVEIGGSEKCVKLFDEILNPDIFVLVSKNNTIKKLGLNSDKVKNSFLQRIPFGVKYYKNLLPLYPIAVEQYDLNDYDLVLSSSHAAAKGVLTNHDQLHICYCYTPVRYGWHLYNQYLKESGLENGFKSIFARIFLHYFRSWDFISSFRVDHYIAISHYIAKRIKKTYNRDSTVIYPPVDVKRFTPVSEKDDYYLTVSRIVPYKKIDLIVKAFNRMNEKKLIVIGSGPGLKKLKNIAGNNIDVRGYGKEDDIVRYMQGAKAFIFAAEEDFGIVPVEAQACGTPVIAYGKGGAAETVINNETGIHFMEQTEDSIIKAVNKFEIDFKYDMSKIRKNSERFSEERFKEEIRSFIDKKYLEFKEKK